ncbi:DUF551 domain-containing protein [Escherichia coli]|uniref:DUF551 domain-containing protein n=1 Tax=Escherichia coli TaxID=562 RepID=UPI001D0CC95B|nr:DUF551 domain-containing protein [Escherichia coli]
MTTTRFTKEQLTKRIEKQIDINSTIIKRLGDDSAAVSELAVKTAMMDMEIFNIALASLEAEPVGAFRKGPCGYSPSFHEDAVPLYTVPPAPVSVPDEWTIFNAVAFVAAYQPPSQEEAALFAWNACRAALLQGKANQAPVKQPSSNDIIGWLRSDYNSDDKRDPNAPLFMLGSNDPSGTWGVKYIPLTGNSPVIPDCWVACSERMPTKQDGTVFMTWNGQYIGKELFLMGSFQCLKPEIITHWMPLPAAPQQEVE